MTDPKTTKAYHHGDLRNAIVSAARTHVEETQEWNFSLRGIAAMVGVSHNAPYTHFADKRDLLAAVGAQGFDQLSEALDEAYQDKNVDGFVAGGKVYINFARANPGLYRLMFDPSFASEAPEEIDVAGKRAFGKLVGALKKVYDGSGMADVEIEGKAFTSWALVHGLALLMIDRRGVAKSLAAVESLPLFVDDALLGMISG